MNRKQPQRHTGLLLACAAAALMIPLSAMAHDDGSSKADDKSMQERTNAMVETAGEVDSEAERDLAGLNPRS